MARAVRRAPLISKYLFCVFFPCTSPLVIITVKVSLSIFPSTLDSSCPNATISSSLSARKLLPVATKLIASTIEDLPLPLAPPIKLTPSPKSNFKFWCERKFWSLSTVNMSWHVSYSVCLANQFFCSILKKAKLD